MVNLAVNAVAGTPTALGVVPAGHRQRRAARARPARAGRARGGRHRPRPADGRVRHVDAVAVQRRRGEPLVRRGARRGLRRGRQRARQRLGDVAMAARAAPGTPSRCCASCRRSASATTCSSSTASGWRRRRCSWRWRTRRPTAAGCGWRRAPGRTTACSTSSSPGRSAAPSSCAIFPRVFSGRHVDHPGVRPAPRRAGPGRCRSTGIVGYADGERVGPLPLDCEAVPGAPCD